jgi:hypothetical protein
VEEVVVEAGTEEEAEGVVGMAEIAATNAIWCCLSAGTISNTRVDRSLLCC